MAQLADRVRQIERLKAEMARASKNNRIERVVYVEMDEDELEGYSDPIGLDKN